MMVSKHFFCVLPFVIFVSIPVITAHYHGHFHDVTPHKEFASESYNSPSPAPSPYSKSHMSSSKGSGSLSGSSASTGLGSGSGASTGSGSLTGSGFGSISGSRSGAFTGSSSFGSGSGSGFGSFSGSGFSDLTGPSSSGSGSGVGSLSGSGFGSFTGSGSFKGSGNSFGSGASQGSSSSSLSGSGSASGSGAFSGSGSFQGSGASTLSGSSDSSGSGASFGSGASQGSGSSSLSGSGSASGSGDFKSSGSFTGSGSSSGSNSSNSGDAKVEINFSGSFSKVFAFGDSYTDTGNARLLNSLKSFVLSMLFRGKNSNFYPGSRSCNGRLVVDFLCDSLNISSLQPYKAISANIAPNANSGVNFAVGGATALSGNFFAKNRIGQALFWKGIPTNFDTQIEWYKKFLAETACKGKSQEECRAEMGKNLVWLGQMGADDFVRVIGSSISMRWLSDITIARVSKLLTTAIDSGAKYIVVQGLPPVGCCPIAKLLTSLLAKDEMGCASGINRAVIAHNELLQKTVEEFRMKHGSKCVIAYADYFNAYKTIMGNLAGFGFSEGSKACCGSGGGFLNFNLRCLCGMLGSSACSNPDGHIHWDGIHLTEAMHREITRLFLHKGFCKPSFGYLVGQYRSSITVNVGVSSQF